ncbi:hypothetical protein ACNNMX_03810 [Aerococcus viridans]|uniref:hypothetical protein n=1 Tax=Aerococcus viridans TaxID=1377 RepID=UPI003AA9C8A8
MTNILLRFNFRELFWLFIIAAFVSNFVGIGTYIPLSVFPLIFIYFINNEFSKSFWLNLAILSAFCIIYSSMLFMYGFGETTSILGKLIYPICFFILGDKLARSSSSYKKVFRYLLVIVLASTLFGFLSVLNTINTFGSMEVARQIIGRSALSFWDSGVIASTILNMNLAFGSSLLGMFFLSDREQEHGKLIKIISLSSFILSTYSIILLGNRTGVLIILASFLIVFLFVQRLNIRKIVITIFSFFFSFIFYLFFQNNTFNLKTSWENSYISTRFITSSLTDDPRIVSWLVAFKGMIVNPMGGRITDISLGTAHNLWLDIGYDAGILPFFLICAFTIASLYSLLVFLIRDHPVYLKAIILGFYTSFLISFMMEPIMLGGVTYFTTFCFVVGMIQRVNQDCGKRDNISDASESSVVRKVKSGV